MSKLYYGVAYYDEYMPADRLAQDIAMMRDANINVVRIAESTWSTLEPREGEYHFFHIDRVLDAMHAAGISVIIGTPTYAIPAWLARKYPAIMVTTPEGQQKYGRRQIMDIVNPDFLRHAETIIRTLLAHVKDHPAIIGYQVDNETKHYDNCGPVMRGKFVRHLQEEFGDTDAINRAWGLDYWSNRIDDWQDFPPPEATINASLACAFSRFQRRCVTEYLAWQAALVNEVRRPDQFVTQNFDFEWRGYSYGVQPRVDHFAAAKAMTLASVDIYHPSQRQLTGKEIAFGGDMARGMKGGGNYFVMETQAQGFAQWTPFPGQLRLQAFSHLASGANMVSYWHWHSIHNSFETYWKGLLSHDFAANPTYREAATIGADFQRLAPQLADLRVTNEVALLVSNEAMDAFNAFKPQGTEGNAYNDVVRRFYDALYEENIPIDIINDVNESSERYKVIVIPALYAAEDALLHRINAYVEKGGKALLSFRSGFSDEQVKVRTCVQPGLLSHCCGVRYSQFVLPDGATLRPKRLALPETATQVGMWMELLTPDGADVLAHYDHPAWGDYAAVTEHRYGRGTALYIGFLPHGDLIKILMQRLGSEALASRHTAQVFPLVVRGGVNPAGERVRYCLNFSGEPQQVTGITGRELLSGNDMDGTWDLPPWGVAIVASPS
ncbi:beta-galactosidase [Chimaeribacter californicus]|uniref:Beta-galactosidase n=1 Tax=Chimaeribacter californicus TaxID=2060067 RepID=A0A2N5E3S4_9GAMM|nr:beta-galactosidase [Chimaeribacter californicus]PLR35477.1 beta-galactosidase [Chimaeribacter californicus]